MHQLRRPAAFLIALWGVFLANPLPGARAVHTYAVVLREPAVGQLLPPRMRGADGRSRLRKMDQETEMLARRVTLSQEPVVAQIEQHDVEVIGSVRHVLNAVFVRATREQAAEIRRLGGVVRVVRSPRFKPLLNRAGEIIRAPEAWNALGGIGNAGAGLKIGIVDTGIDADHPALRDSSLVAPAGFPKGRPEDLAFTNSKVIVARSYVGLLNPDDPTFSRPDDFSPRDRVGHGTAVATIAAGQRVNGPAAVITGVAPKAFVGNYKIFGAPDINEFSNSAALISAIDDAVLDGMDIIGISFGAVAQFAFDEQGDACSDDADVLCDPVAAAAQSAMEDFGVVVVAAAGNAGAFGEQRFPAWNSISSPGSAPAVITVGATVNARQFVQSVVFGGQRVVAISGSGPKPQEPLTAPAIHAEELGDPLACELFPFHSLDGRIAVVDRGGCDFEFKVANVYEAGGIGVIVTNIDGDDEPFVMVGLEATDIPAFMVGDSDGERLGSFVRGNRTAPVTLDPTPTERSFAWDQIAPFSSRGPSPGNHIKPDLVAPGTFIYAGAQRFDSNADAYSPDGFTSVDGTSFAAPMVAGAAALIMQRHPEFTAAEVKSALVNTAAPVIIEDGELARVNSVGTGLLDVPIALDPIATVVPATLSFGDVGNTALPIERSLTLRNTGGGPATFLLRVEEREGDANASVLVDGSSLTSVQLGANQSVDVPVALQGSRPQPGSYEGFLRVQRTSGGEDLLVPFYYAVGDGVPDNSFAIAGTGVVGTVNEPHPELLIFRVIDQYGQPVPDLPVTFRVVEGRGSIFTADPDTDFWGIAAADVDMGPDVGPQDFEAQAGNLTVPFFNAARPKPSIGGVVNGASFSAGEPVAAGSIVSIFGENIAEFLGSAQTVPLPIALKHVSVSFDFPEEGLSVPGRFYYVSPQQVNIQVPWELAGFNFALVKIRIEDSVSAVFTVNLADYAPGIFEFERDGQQFGVITHADGSLVTRNQPARAGETVILYATGLGPVNQPQESGQAAPVSPLARTQVTPVVRVAGRDAVVEFAGLTPGFVGLYQVNVTLPAGLAGGNQELLLTSNGIAASPVTIPIQ